MEVGGATISCAKSQLIVASEFSVRVVGERGDKDLLLTDGGANDEALRDELAISSSGGKGCGGGICGAECGGTCSGIGGAIREDSPERGDLRGSSQNRHPDELWLGGHPEPRQSLEEMWVPGQA